MSMEPRTGPSELGGECGHEGHMPWAFPAQGPPAAQGVLWSRVLRSLVLVLRLWD